MRSIAGEPAEHEIDLSADSGQLTIRFGVVVLAGGDGDEMPTQDLVLEVGH